MSRETTGPGGSQVTPGEEDMSRYVPTTRTVNSKALSADIALTAADVGAVPTTRTVNGKALSADIALAATDVGAVPTTRTVNGHALSGDVAVTLADLGLAAKQTGDLISPNGVFEITGMNCNANAAAGFEAVFVAKVFSAAGGPWLRLLVNGSDANAFLNAGEVVVWGAALVRAYQGINVLAGNAGNYPPQQAFAGDDVVLVRIRCDIAKQSFGFNRRVVNVVVKHVASSAFAPTIQAEGNFVLDESVAAGQNIDSIGIKLEGGTWAGGSHYTLSRLPL